MSRGDRWCWHEWEYEVLGTSLHLLTLQAPVPWNILIYVVLVKKNRGKWKQQEKCGVWACLCLNSVTGVEAGKRIGLEPWGSSLMGDLQCLSCVMMVTKQFPLTGAMTSLPSPEPWSESTLCSQPVHSHPHTPFFHVGSLRAAQTKAFFKFHVL